MRISLRFVAGRAAFLGLLAVPAHAVAAPLELSYAGQLTDAAGLPIASLDAGASAGQMGGVRITFWTSSWNGGAAPQTPPGTQRNVSLRVSDGGAVLTVAHTLVTSCSPGGSFAFTQCQTVATNDNGVFHANLFLSLADFDTLFPATGASSYIQVERVYVNINTGAVTPVTYYPRQRFTTAPYCLKVPVDGTSVAFASGNLSLASGGVTSTHLAGNIPDSKLATISTAGKVSGSAITSGTIGGTTSFNTSGSVTAGAGSFTSLTVGGGASHSGSGTTGYLSKWTGTSSLGSSALFEDGSGNIGVGKTSPGAKLDVNGTLIASTLSTPGTVWAGTLAGNLSASYLTGAIANSQLATITTAGKVSGSAITSGTIGGSTAINTTGQMQVLVPVTGSTGDVVAAYTTVTSPATAYNGNLLANQGAVLLTNSVSGGKNTAGGNFSTQVLTGNGAGSAGAIQGVISGVDHYGSGTLEKVVGASSWVTNQSSGVMASASGLSTTMRNWGSGTISSAVGLVVNSPEVTAGGITNYMGIYIANPAVSGVANPWALYAPAGRNYFGGQVILGNFMTTRWVQPEVDYGYHVGSSAFRYSDMHAVNFYGTMNAGPDVAERYEADETLEPGTLVSWSTDALKLTTAARANEDRLAGIISSNPGIVLGDRTGYRKTGYPLGLIGRVPVRVSLENGPVAVGDLLALSSTPGVAMKATGGARIVGRALEAFDGARVESFGVYDHLIRPNTKPAPYRPKPAAGGVGKIMAFLLPGAPRAEAVADTARAELKSLRSELEEKKAQLGRLQEQLDEVAEVLCADRPKLRLCGRAK